MILATKQGQNGGAGLKAQPYTNPTPGAVAETPSPNRNVKALDRPLVTGNQTLGQALVGWLGKLTLSGGDLDGQKFEVWPWERKFILGTFGQSGNAALSLGRGNGKSAFVAALAAAVVCPGTPLHGVRREVVCVASSFQ